MTTHPGARSPWPLPRELMILIGGGMVVLIIAGLRSAASMIAPIFLALVFAITVQPIGNICKRRGWPAWAQVGASLVAAYGLLLVVSTALVVAAAKFATLVPHYKNDMNDLVQSATDRLQDLGVGPSQLQGITGSFDAGKLVKAAASLLQSLLGVSSNLVFVILLLLFIAMDAGDFPEKLSNLRGGQPSVVSALESFAHGTRQYMIVSTVFGFIVAALDTIFLTFTPVPEPLLWGLLAFVTNYIPNVGFLIGVAPPALLGLLEGGPGLMVVIIVVYVALNFIIQSLIQPKFVGDTVGLSVAVTFLSLVFWAWVFGALGALLAVPLSLLLKALIIDTPGGSTSLQLLVSGEPAPHPVAQPE